MNRKELEKFTCEVLRLRLCTAKLATTGNKAALVERLLTCTFGTPQASQSQNAKTCPTLHPSPKIPANLRARVQQPSPTSRPNLPRLLRWNPDADANARHTGSKDVVDQLALPRALHTTLAALPPPARTVRTTADASARHDGTEKAALSVTTGTGTAAPSHPGHQQTLL